ncbi:Zinc finger BED domain-containing protein RICESLEEPER [Trichinella spiralis]
MSSRRGSYTRPRRRSISRSQTPKRSTHQIVVPSSGLKLQKRPSAVLLDGGEAPSEIICPTCSQSLRSRSRSKSITRKKSLGKKVARKVSVRQRSKSGGKSRRNKKRSVKKSNQKAVLIKASKSPRKRSSLKSIPKQKRYSLRSRAVVR